MKEKSLVKNGFFNVIRTFSSIVFPVVTFAYASRILGDTGIGRVSFANSVITYFTMLATLGMKYYGTREAAKLRDNKVLFDRFAHEMLVINLITTAAAYGLLIVAMLAIPKFRGYQTLLLISSVAIVLQGMGMEWLYQAVEEYRYIAMRSVVFQVVSLGALFIFVRDADDVVPYAVVHLAATSGSYILNFFNARKYISFRRCGPYELKRHIKPILWLFAMAVSVELYTVLDSTMLGFLSGDAAVGRYAAAIKVNKLVNSLIISIGVVLIPRLSYYAARNEMDKITSLVAKAYNYVFLLSVPAAVGLFMLSDEIIMLFSGREFAPAAYTMRLLTPIVLVIPFSVVTNQQTFVPMGKEKLILLSTTVGAITNLILNRVLIPHYAENGAAVATDAAEMAVAAVCFINICRFLDIKQLVCSVWQYCLAALVIPVAVSVIKMINTSYLFHLVLAIPVSVILYLLTLLLLRNQYAKEAALIVKELLLGRGQKSR